MILLAIESDGYVSAYDETKSEILKTAGQLYNYTDNYVFVSRRNDKSIIDIYNNVGEKVFTYPYDFIDTSNIQGIVL